MTEEPEQDEPEPDFWAEIEAIPLKDVIASNRKTAKAVERKAGKKRKPSWVKR